jgi:Ca-activated chloride channel family protein
MGLRVPWNFTRNTGVARDMQKTLARFLLAALFTTSCKSHDEAGVNVDLVATESTTLRSAATTQDDTAPDESGGTGTAMSLEEGKLGKKDSERAEGISSITSNGNVSSGFDTAGVYGSLGAGGGGTAGIIGSGKYGTIGGGYGYGRGGMRGRSGSIGDSQGSESYKKYDANGWTDATKDKLSTFAADVDTASYTIARRKLTENMLPPAASVRVEEMVNYFNYSYPAPAAGSPFSVTSELAPSPFDANKRILRVGVSTKALSIAERKSANLVFLVDVSGSMSSADKLPLAKRSLRILVDNLKDGDTVALVTYAGATRVVLPPTGLEHRNEILAAIEDLSSGGSTAMSDGIKLAYEQAMQGLRPGAISRVIVLSDGDANVGRTSHDEILTTIRGKVKEGVTLSTIGFGMGNYKDELMEQLANKGNGNNFYIDGLSQAKRVFQQQLGSTLEVVAKDVKLQVEFDATQVKQYRLIGYENRDIADNDFRNDKVDAGEIGAGHQVTALYELELAKPSDTATVPIVTVRVRHKAPNGTTATEAAFPLTAASISPTFTGAPADFQFAFAVAGFGDILRGGADAKTWDLKTIRSIASGAAGSADDRKEFVQLVDKAIELRKKTS